MFEIGTNKNVAKVLVFLANIPEASSRAIERGTDTRQPEINLAMKYLMNQGWIRIRESLGKNKSRPTKVYELAKPITEILNCIEKEKKEMMNNQLSLVRKLRDYLK